MLIKANMLIKACVDEMFIIILLIISVVVSARPSPPRYSNGIQKDVAYLNPTPSNPFCGFTRERNTVTVDLVCVRGTIAAVTFAAFGTPSGSCPSYIPSPTCNDPSFLSYARATCVGKPRCTLQSQGDPCPGTVKSIAVVANCSEGPGGYQPRPLPAPSCAVSGLPCPVPVEWPVTWNLTQSTVIQPSSAEYFAPAHPWGLVSLDWSVAARVWFKGNTSNTTCEATLINNCRMLKASGKATFCFIYHNMELALQWLESQRAVMYAPADAAMFLQYTDGAGRKLGRIYNEPQGTYGDQYFWDFREQSAREYFIGSILDVLNDPAVDGTFTDDVTGVPEEHPDVAARINMSAADLADLQYNTQVAGQLLISALALNGKGNWQVSLLSLL